MVLVIELFFYNFKISKIVEELFFVIVNDGQHRNFLLANLQYSSFVYLTFLNINMVVI